ncbi:30S ribosomal protein S12 methylthiotransferase RimO [Sporolituus thermophilus]|uniref:Ribosomal protein uS12 methylthiotransferase RimO n=1 Tax=Sporolituus thermophilus DSM 23256 TaxID=1123285 RepID=A0A1G7NSN4_9FIRM|nr:30S ribosomal protein S12 methylthiotransferase RimO [Sporolituus thermophilus]SDF76250.1 SSU ribosomal protein S12P methylthiotransferase [Sporolituus thermophilus DSM 23256]
MLKAGFVSLGCAKNLVDTEVMLGILTDNNIAIVDNPGDADILIVNTCGFIDSAKEESITTILQMAEYKKESNCRALIVAGCLGQRYQQELLDELPEVDAIVGTGAWHRIMEAVQAALSGQRVLVIGPTETIYDETMPRIHTTPKYSAYVKVAEGCSNCCSYCVIPLVRGRFRSRPQESIVNEVKRLAANGIKEINLIAQDTTSYGRDLYGQPRLPQLLRSLVKIEGIEWIRLLYCYPRYFTDELIEVMAKEPKICKYVDLPLQHIHDDILKAMHRRDSRFDIEGLLAKIRKTIPDVAIRTSFIVGFPGETDDHFQALQEFMQVQKFDHVGIFTYSQEEGTVAGAMADQVPEEVKQERYHALMALQCQISEEINRQLEGRVLKVLVEGKSDQPGVVFGRSYREAPDVDGRVYVEGATGSRAGDLIVAKVVQGFTYDLLAEKI